MSVASNTNNHYIINYCYIRTDIEKVGTIMRVD